MSWDFSLAVRLGSGQLAELRGYDANYTYNVSEMFYDAFAGEDGIRGLNEMACETALPLIQAALTKMLQRPEHYRAMNPKNGWGDYDGAVDLLRKLRDWCESAPGALLVVS